MRTPFRLASMVLALAIPLTAASQDAPRVLFCSGGCFAVDAKGVRTPAPKGTVLRPGQRLETSAGAYAQVKLSPATAVGISEQASIRLDQNAVVLDQGRIRMVGAQAFGKPITQPVELRTLDGTVVLRGADIEAKKTDLGRATPTLVRVNAGDARLGKGPGEIRLPTQAVQGITTGKLAGAVIPITDILPAQPAPGTLSVPDLAATAPIIVSTTLVTQPILIDTTLTRTLTTTTLATQPVITEADKLLNTQLVSPTGTLVKVTDVLKTDTTVQPVVYEAPRTTTTTFEPTSTQLSTQQTQVQTCTTCTQTQYQFQTVR
jgi:hypothetical protein